MAKGCQGLSSSAASRGVAAAGDFAHHSKPAGKGSRTQGAAARGAAATYREAAPHGGPCPGPSQGAGLGWEARKQHLRHASSTPTPLCCPTGVGCHPHTTHTGLGHTGPGHAALVHTQRCLGYASAAPGHGRCAPVCTLGLGLHTALSPTHMHQYRTHTNPECVECKALGIIGPQVISTNLLMYLGQPASSLIPWRVGSTQEGFAPLRLVLTAWDLLVCRRAT